MTEANVPTSLLNHVRANFEPVRPLASPLRRMLALVPLAMLLFFGPPMYFQLARESRTIARMGELGNVSA